MNIDLTKLGQFFLKLVKLPPLRLVIAILLIIIGVQFYERQVRVTDEKEKTKLIISKLDSCKAQSYRDERWWALRLDSVRIETAKKFEDAVLDNNKKTEEALERQKEANRTMERIILNQSKHR